MWITDTLLDYNNACLYFHHTNGSRNCRISVLFCWVICLLCGLPITWFIAGYRPTLEFFTNMETLPFPAYGFKFRPMTGAHWYLEGFFSVPNPLHYGTFFKYHLRGPKVLLPRGGWSITTWLKGLDLSRPAFEHPTFRRYGESFTDSATAIVVQLVTLKIDAMIQNCLLTSILYVSFSNTSTDRQTASVGQFSGHHNWQLSMFSHEPRTIWM